MERTTGKKPFFEPLKYRIYNHLLLSDETLFTHPSPDHGIAVHHFSFYFGIILNTPVMKPFLLLFALSQFIVITLFAQAGTLDADFGSGGLVKTSFGPDDNGICVAIAPNQKIIAGGMTYDSTGKTVFAITCMLPNGQPDRNFGRSGKITYGFGIDCPFGVKTIAVQPDGYIIAAGTLILYDAGNTPVAQIIRFTPTGDIDPAFHGGGPLLISYFEPSSIALQTNGKIVIGASYKGNMGVLRVNSDGTLDTDFGTSGHVLITGDAKNGGETTSVLVQPDGKIVWAGAYDYWDLMVARCNNRGVLDANFGAGGVARITVNTNELCSINAIALDSRNRIITAGGHYSESANKDEILICALKSNGVLDNSFAGNGKMNVSITDLCSAKGVAVQSNDQIVAVGMSWHQQQHKWILCRANNDGTLDTNFGSGGKVTTVWPDDFDAAYGVAIQADGKIVVEGYAGYAFGTARYIAKSLKSVIFGDAMPVQSTSVTSSLDATGLTISPNPAQAQLTIHGLNPSGQTIISVKDAIGRDVLTTKTTAQSEYTLDIHALPPGTYFLQLSDGKKRQTKTFQKMH